MAIKIARIVSAEDVDAAGTTRVFLSAGNSPVYVPPDPENMDRIALTRWVADFGGVIDPYVP